MCMVCSATSPWSLSTLTQQQQEPVSQIAPPQRNPKQQWLYARSQELQAPDTNSLSARILHWIHPDTLHRLYDGGWDRPYLQTEAKSLLQCTALSALSIPVFTTRSIAHLAQVFFQNSEQELHWIKFKELLGHTVCSMTLFMKGLIAGTAKALLSPLYDTARKTEELANREKYPEGRAALLAIDAQNDFFDEGTIEIEGNTFTYEKGSLAVPQACEILPPIQTLYQQKDEGVLFLASQDWHPPSHGSFAVNLGTPPFTQTTLKGRDQTAWPIHCVPGTRGVELVEGLPKPDRIIRKGQNPQVDSYSAFLDNNQKDATTLKEWLDYYHVKTLFIFGLAYDFCVGWSVKDALREGFQVILVEDATRGIQPESVAQMRNELQQLGAEILSSQQAIQQYPQFFPSNTKDS